MDVKLKAEDVGLAFSAFEYLVSHSVSYGDRKIIIKTSTDNQLNQNLIRKLKGDSKFHDRADGDIITTDLDTARTLVKSSLKFSSINPEFVLDSTHSMGAPIIEAGSGVYTVSHGVIGDNVNKIIEYSRVIDASLNAYKTS